MNLAAILGVCQRFDLLVPQPGVLDSVERTFLQRPWSSTEEATDVSDVFGVGVIAASQFVPIKFGVWGG